jgi:hypothetical protein
MILTFYIIILLYTGHFNHKVCEYTVTTLFLLLKFLIEVIIDIYQINVSTNCVKKYI